VKHLVMLEGSGFQLRINGKLQTVGFYATRLVEASSQREIDADRLMDALYDDLRKSGVTPTRASQISISEVKPLQDGMLASSSGFTFFVEDS
jgi:hypothetical protein